MIMAAYYQVRVKVKTEDEKGRIKAHTEMYLVAGETPEDAAFKTREYYGAETRDYSVESVNETRYLAVID